MFFIVFTFRRRRYIGKTSAKNQWRLSRKILWQLSQILLPHPPLLAQVDEEELHLARADLDHLSSRPTCPSPGCRHPLPQVNTGQRGPLPCADFLLYPSNLSCQGLGNDTEVSRGLHPLHDQVHPFPGRQFCVPRPFLFPFLQQLETPVTKIALLKQYNLLARKLWRAPAASRWSRKVEPKAAVLC